MNEMETVVITEKEFQKGKEWLKKVNWINWVTTEENEIKVAKAIENSNARIVVLGVEKYYKELYSALGKDSRPSLIARYGVGCDGINRELCKQNNIILVNTPNVLDRSVAEHAVALLLSIARKIPQTNLKFLKGDFTSSIGFELYGKSIGIAGFGNIGKRVAEILGRGFSMKVYAFDIYSLEEQSERHGMGKSDFIDRFNLTGYFNDFEMFISKIDILSIHMPSREDTYHFFNLERLRKLRKGSIVINTSRGKLLDEEALFLLLKEGYLSGAALDVFENEPYVPAAENCDLRKLANIVLTSHIASNTVEANKKMSEKVVENIKNFIEGKFKLLPKIV